MRRLKTCLGRLAACWILWPGGAAYAASDAPCSIIRISDLGASELINTTAAVAAVLETLGYKPQSLAWPQDKTFAGLADGTIDVFFGADTRKMSERISALLDLGAVEVAGVNQTFAEPVLPSETTGSGEMALGRLLMVSPPAVPSTTGAAEAQNAETGKAPDPQSPFPPGMLTLVRADFAQACPNVATFLRNLTFPPDLATFITIRMVNEYDALFDAAAMWFGENRDVLDLWLAGVKTIDDTDAKSAALQDFGF